MKITIFGTGYVGLVTGACLADVGHRVTCVDIDKEKINGLNDGIIPIYEPGLDDIVIRNSIKGRLHFTTDVKEPIKVADVIFIAVGTPPDEDGSADLQHVLKVASDIGKYYDGYKVVVTKSTVPVGTADLVRQEIIDQGIDEDDFSVASNPEFLKEGDAIQDFMKPDRIVVGISDEYSRDVMAELYRPFTLNGHPVIFMDIKSAEVTKYAANAMLATKISFINEIANFCDAVGADVDAVRQGITSDSRIGNKFLYPGIGYGGSCVTGDTLVSTTVGKIPIFELKDKENITVISTDSELEIKNIKNVLEVTKRTYNGNMLQFEWEDEGKLKSFTCTEDHYIPINRNGNIKLVQAKEINLDDLLYID